MESSQKQCRDVLVVLRTAPKALLAGYFVNAFILSFPMVAMADWLNNHIEMPLATQAQFYAFVFVPNCFKPLYASLANVVAKWISGSSSEARSWLRGRSRSLVLQVCGLCMGVLYVLACRVALGHSLRTQHTGEDACNGRRPPNLPGDVPRACAHPGHLTPKMHYHSLIA